MLATARSPSPVRSAADSLSHSTLRARPVNAIHPSDWKRIAALLDHRILHRAALMKNPANSRKKSHSLVTRTNSPRGWTASSSRGCPWPGNAWASSCATPAATAPAPSPLSPVPWQLGSRSRLGNQASPPLRAHLSLVRSFLLRHLNHSPQTLLHGNFEAIAHHQCRSLDEHENHKPNSHKRGP